MSLIHWRPFLEPFEEFEKDLVEGFRNFPARAGVFGARVPAIDVYEEGDTVVVEAEVPGVDPEKVEVSVENNVLTLKGESEKKTEVDEKGYYRKEVRRGSFYRQVSLPARVQGDKAEANYEKGVLKVTIPKAEAEKGRKIEVKVKK